MGAIEVLQSTFGETERSVSFYTDEKGVTEANNFIKYVNFVTPTKKPQCLVNLLNMTSVNTKSLRAIEATKIYLNKQKTHKLNITK